MRMSVERAFTGFCNQEYRTKDSPNKLNFRVKYTRDLITSTGNITFWII